MPAYLIANIIGNTDPAAMARYRSEVAPLIEKAGGRYLVRGGAVENVEGDPGFDRLVIIEYPSMAALKAFYHGPDYAPLLALRAGASLSHVALVEGYVPG
jgi:uncharacterized protein (DUF1330 family)